MVSVQPAGSLPLDEERVRAIRNLVVKVIAGLLSAMLRHRGGSQHWQSWSGDSSDGGSASDDAYFTRMRLPGSIQARDSRYPLAGAWAPR